MKPMPLKHETRYHHLGSKSETSPNETVFPPFLLSEPPGPEKSDQAAAEEPHSGWDGDGGEADIVKVSRPCSAGCLFKYQVDAIGGTAPNGTKNAVVEAKRVRMPSIIVC